MVVAKCIEEDDKKLEAECYKTIGVFHQKQGKYIEAIRFYNKAIDINKQIDDKAAMAKSMNNIGIIHAYQGNYDQALTQYKA